jgi:hypothetical protein
LSGIGTRNEVIRAAAELQAVCEGEGWQDRIDWAYAWEQLAPLVELEEAPEILPRPEQRRQDLNG